MKPNRQIIGDRFTSPAAGENNGHGQLDAVVCEFEKVIVLRSNSVVPDGRVDLDFMVISGRSLGSKRKALFDDFSIPIPPARGDDGLTLRELITRIVCSEVEAFASRQQARRLTRVLTPSQIQDGMDRGKIDSGGSDLEQKVEADAAVAAALQAFEDGLYLVVIDEIEQRSLDAQVFVKPGSRITFIRLVFLAGA